MVTGNMGEFLPIACVPVLPGDTFQHRTNVLVRCSPLNAPVMHPTAVRIHHFFVPNRLVWDGWEDFITGGPDGADTSQIPQVAVSDPNKSLSCYLGAAGGALGTYTINALPVRAANKIFNEFYRDQDLVTERLEDDDTIPLVAWEKDYFTTARPWTQKGPEVVVPVGDRADVVFDGPVGQDIGLKMDGGATDGTINDQATGNLPVIRSNNAPTSGEFLYADLANAAGISVNDFRTSFALQRYQEARARYGSRFTEYLRYLGVRPSDARLQRPEYLGGGSARLQFSEVLQTANDEQDATGPRSSTGVGDMYGHGIAGAGTNRYRKFFEEHGYVITILSVRPKTLYMNATQRDFLKRTKEDFFQKELVHLGQQEIWDEELYPDDNNARGGFGFQDRYDEYRQSQSMVHGEFKNLLAPYHMGRALGTTPALNAAFVSCDPDDRIYQVGTDTADGLWIMANHHIVARRLVPKVARPRIL